MPFHEASAVDDRRWKSSSSFACLTCLAMLGRGSWCPSRSWWATLESGQRQDLNTSGNDTEHVGEWRWDLSDRKVTLIAMHAWNRNLHTNNTKQERPAMSFLSPVGQGLVSRAPISVHNFYPAIPTQNTLCASTSVNELAHWKPIHIQTDIYIGTQLRIHGMQNGLHTYVKVRPNMTVCGIFEEGAMGHLFTYLRHEKSADDSMQWVLFWRIFPPRPGRPRPRRLTIDKHYTSNFTVAPDSTA